MRPITMERVEDTRKQILDTIESATLTHEQKVTNLANLADSLLEVLDLPEGLDELLNSEGDAKCICDLFEGHAPMRPRYIAPDYEKLLKEGCEYLRLPAPTDLMEALNTLLIFYKHVPSITNYPVYLGQLDELLEPFVDTVDEAMGRKLVKNFLMNVDRTILDSFSHADVGPRETKIGYYIFDAEKELQDAVPNISMKYDADITPDHFLKAAVECGLACAKPSFANHKMFVSELGERYVIASCYNGLPLGGGSYTLCRLILGNIAKRSKDITDFKENQLPYVMDIMARYMDARVKFEVEESGYFDNTFLIKEGFIEREKFTAMYGLVGLADAVNILLEKEGKTGRFGHDEIATQLGVEIMDIIDAFNQNHEAPYCEVTGGHYLLHAQVGIAEDQGITPGVRIPIGEEPDELIDQLEVMSHFHKYFPSGTGDIFPVDMTVHANPEYVMDIIKGSFQRNLRYLSFYSSDNDVIRVTGYLIKRSELEKLDSGVAVIHDTTALGLGASKNGHILERKVR